MNTKYTVAFGDKYGESIITFVTSKQLLYDFLKSQGYKVIKWELIDRLTFVEYDGDRLPTGRYFMLLNSTHTIEPESEEVVFF